MSSAGETEPPAFSPSVFLSYASEDRAAARSIRDALAAAGLEVWYDENELGGGDAWDQKIRKQIRDCVYFMPVISARTEARHEGYFRREWRLAVERTQDMADDILFLLPVVIDGTDQGIARVPERFLTVQWIKVPEGKPTPALNALCKRLVSGRAVLSPPVRRAPPTLGKTAKPAEDLIVPPFPHEEPGQRLRFFGLVFIWACQAAWITFKKLPRFLRGLVIFFLVITLLSNECSHRSNKSDSVPRVDSAAEQAKLAALAKKFGGSANTSATDLGKLGVEISQGIMKEINDPPSGKHVPLLAVPFTAPEGDAPGAGFANAVFVQLYGQLSVKYADEVGISKDPLTGFDLADSARERAKSRHSNHIIYGQIEGTGDTRTLVVKILDRIDDDNSWTKSYPLTGISPEVIATEIASHVTDLDEGD